MHLCIILKLCYLLEFVDEERFGYRMMQRMGWSKGRGLGAKEDGMASFVKLRKIDVLGE